MIEHGDIDRAVSLGHADTLAKGSDRFRCVAAPADTGQRRHPWVVPPCNVSLLHQLQEFSFAQNGVREIEAGKLDLLRMVDLQLVKKPVVQRWMVLKFQGANRMRDSLDRMRLPVGEI